MKPTMMIPLALVGLLAAACSHDATPAQTPSTTNTTTTTAYNPAAQPAMDNQALGANQDVKSGAVATAGVGDNGMGSSDSSTSNSTGQGGSSAVTTPGSTYAQSTQQKGAQAQAALSSPQADAKPTQPATAGTSAKSAKSATDQGQSNSEVKISARIRKTMMVSKSLSFGAKNVKVITQGDKVTLIGNVKSDAEKNEIEGIAKNTDGVSNVDDQLVVKQ